jgi:hypothetical protein
MVGGLRAMTTRQLPPNCEEVITMLRTVLSQCTYPDLDLSTEEDAHTLLARRQCAEAAMHRLEIELGFREHRLRRKKTKHHAVESDNRGAPLNVAPLARGQYLLIKLEQSKRSCHRYDRIHPVNGHYLPCVLCRRSSCRERLQQTAPLFDHLVGTSDQRVWNSDAERLGCLEVDRKLNFGGLLDRYIHRLLPLRIRPAKMPRSR